MSSNTGILLKGVFNPKLLNNPPAYCFLINLDFYYSAMCSLIKALFFLYFPF